MSTTDKWDTRGDTRLPDVVQRVLVYDEALGDYRPTRPGEVERVPRSNARPAADAPEPARTARGPW